MALPGVEWTEAGGPGLDEILTLDALAFVAGLERTYGPTRLSRFGRAAADPTPWPAVLDAMAALLVQARRIGAPVPAIRPRGWFAAETNMRVDGKPISAALFDFGLGFFHVSRPILARGGLPLVDLGRVATLPEARLWHDVLTDAQLAMAISPGTLRVGVTANPPILAILHPHSPQPSTIRSASA